VGEDTGAGEESGLVAWGACCGEVAAGFRVWVLGNREEICLIETHLAPDRGNVHIFGVSPQRNPSDHFIRLQSGS